MNALLDKAISAIQKLPEAEQEAIAREVLERIEADARWDTLLSDARSEAALNGSPMRPVRILVAGKW
jgi:hypothetical protein